VESENGDQDSEDDEDNDDDDDQDDDDDDQDSRKVFEEWLAKQDEKIQKLVADGTEGLRSALQKERKAAKEAVRLQAELDKYKTDDEKALEASQAEVDELTTQFTDATKLADDAVANLVKERIKYAVTIQALKMGFADPDDAQALLPKDHKVKYNKKDDKVEGVEEALKA